MEDKLEAPFECKAEKSAKKTISRIRKICRELRAVSGPLNMYRHKACFRRSMEIDYAYYNLRLSIAQIEEILNEMEKNKSWL